MIFVSINNKLLLIHLMFVHFATNYLLNVALFINNKKECHLLFVKFGEAVLVDDSQFCKKDFCKLLSALKIIVIVLSMRNSLYTTIRKILI